MRDQQQHAQTLLLHWRKIRDDRWRAEHPFYQQITYDAFRLGHGCFVVFSGNAAVSEYTGTLDSAIQAASIHAWRQLLTAACSNNPNEQERKQARETIEIVTDAVSDALLATTAGG